MKETYPVDTLEPTSIAITDDYIQYQQIEYEINKYSSFSVERIGFFNYFLAKPINPLSNDVIRIAIPQSAIQDYQKLVSILNERVKKDYDGFDLEYIGGHPDYNKTIKLSCQITSESIILSGLEIEGIVIEKNEIVDVRVESKVEVYRRVTASQIMLFGLYAFAFAKKKHDVDYFLILDVRKSDNSQFTMIFVGNSIIDVRDSIINKLLTTNYPSTENFCSQKSISEQLREYKNLLDDGILTQEEFDKVKKRLLNIWVGINFHQAN